MDALISAAYRQIFNEQQLLKSNRQTFLESQLRFGQLSVRDFIRGLATSDPFRQRNYECNNNYRFVQMCVQRILGREVYSDREKLAWSIVLATKGPVRVYQCLTQQRGIPDQLWRQPGALSTPADFTPTLSRRVAFCADASLRRRLSPAIRATGLLPGSTWQDLYLGVAEAPLIQKLPVRSAGRSRQLVACC